MTSSLYPHLSERLILFLIGAVQFINILDFVMVLPLGPDYAPYLGIPTADLGWIGGSYTAAAAVAGILSSLFIDRFDRKSALLIVLAGLMLATAFGGFAWDFNSLLIGRIVAGLFGGPATSLVLSIVADTIEPERRGQAMGKIMGAFSLASIFGVPFGLEMARMFGWKAPFFIIAGAGVLIFIATWIYLPKLNAHLKLSTNAPTASSMLEQLTRPTNMLAYLYVMLAMTASFMIIPNLSAYTQFNLHYPRDHIGWLYSAGGIVSLITMRITGFLIDRFNATLTAFLGALVFMYTLWTTFIHPHYDNSVMLFFILLMTAMGLRNVSSTTLASKIPPPQERAGFMSIFSCLQASGMAFGAFLSAHILTENTDHSLNGMAFLAYIAMALTICVPLLTWRVETRLVKPQ